MSSPPPHDEEAESSTSEEEAGEEPRRNAPNEGAAAGMAERASTPPDPSAGPSVSPTEPRDPEGLEYISVFNIEADGCGELVDYFELVQKRYVLPRNYPIPGPRRAVGLFTLPRKMNPTPEIQFAQEQRADDGDEERADDGHEERADDGHEERADDGHEERADDGHEERDEDGADDGDDDDDDDDDGGFNIMDFLREVMNRPRPLPSRRYDRGDGLSPADDPPDDDPGEENPDCDQHDEQRGDDPGEEDPARDQHDEQRGDDPGEEDPARDQHGEQRGDDPGEEDPDREQRGDDPGEEDPDRDQNGEQPVDDPGEEDPDRDQNGEQPVDDPGEEDPDRDQNDVENSGPMDAGKAAVEEEKEKIQLSVSSGDRKRRQSPDCPKDVDIRPTNLEFLFDNRDESAEYDDPFCTNATSSHSCWTSHLRHLSHTMSAVGEPLPSSKGRRTRSVSVSLPLTRNQERLTVEVGQTLRRLSDEFSDKLRKRECHLSDEEYCQRFRPFFRRRPGCSADSITGGNDSSDLPQETMLSVEPVPPRTLGFIDKDDGLLSVFSGPEKPDTSKEDEQL